MADILASKKGSSKSKLVEPGKYKVILLNDDKTSMEFVVALLTSLFHHDVATSNKIMMEVHTSGAGVAGVYPHEVANQKCKEGMNLAKQYNYPLQLKVVAE